MLWSRHLLTFQKPSNRFCSHFLGRFFSSVQIKEKCSIKGQQVAHREQHSWSPAKRGSIPGSCASAPSHTADDVCRQEASEGSRFVSWMTTPSPGQQGNEQWQGLQHKGEPDLTWVLLRDYTVPTSHLSSHLLCPLASGSGCGCPGCVVFGERASSSFSCCTSRARCCSKSLFCSSSWWTRAWASMRAAVSAAIWSFNSCTCSGDKGQGVFAWVWTFLIWFISKT